MSKNRRLLSYTEVFTPECTTVPPETFYAELGHRDEVAKAKAICRRCPIIEQCLADALDRNEQHGTWGGLSKSERQVLRRGLRMGLVQPPK